MNSTLKIGPLKWDVKVDETFALEAADLLGLTHHPTTTIYVSSTAGEERRREVLLHEILHACIESHSVSHEDEEMLVTEVAPVLLDVLRQNPHLVKYLTE